MNSSWLKSNAWHLFSGGALVMLLAGQYQERQSNMAGRLTAVEQRVLMLEGGQSTERTRLDPIYTPREVSTTQQSEISRRLGSIESELRELRSELRTAGRTR